MKNILNLFKTGVIMLGKGAYNLFEIIGILINGEKMRLTPCRKCNMIILFKTGALRFKQEIR